MLVSSLSVKLVYCSYPLLQLILNTYLILAQIGRTSKINERKTIGREKEEYRKRGGKLHEEGRKNTERGEENYRKRVGKLKYSNSGVEKGKKSFHLSISVQ